ncbi:hypothetical protein NDU88_003389 [Pleurodeles waltl]|uniref:Uncharacterized protein n=1 Tax=Pleurodeles waltl TaxID=8319 RepID=A0AAV7SFM3_PLEWA|nr:hypothetical protein NDU88_003389 [Pleurodeles waltl]
MKRGVGHGRGPGPEAQLHWSRWARVEDNSGEAPSTLPVIPLKTLGSVAHSIPGQSTNRLPVRDSRCRVSRPGRTPVGQPADRCVRGWRGLPCGGGRRPRGDLDRVL